MASRMPAVLILLAVLQPFQAAAFAGLRRQLPSVVPMPTDGEIAVPPCMCECCTVMRREPQEIQTPAVYLKCAQIHEDDGFGGTAEAIVADADDKMKEVGVSSVSCPVTCDPKDRDSVLHAAEQPGDDAVDYNRFCFYHCQPYDFTVGGICIKHSEVEEDVHRDGSGNGRDAQLHPVVASHTDIHEVHVIEGAPEEQEIDSVGKTTPLPCENRVPCLDGLAQGHADDANKWLEKARRESGNTRDVATGLF